MATINFENPALPRISTYESDRASASAPVRRRADVSDADLVLLLGAPRSGTTWLAKILDSHPLVRYRHEPDTVLREDRLPMLCPTADIPLYRDRAGDYLQTLAACRTVKTAASRPLLRKGRESAVAFGLRKAAAAALRNAERVAWRVGLPAHLPMPALTTEPPGDGRFVIKSVSARGRAGLFADAAPRARIVFLLRHPGGQVASMLRGLREGRHDVDPDFEAVLAAEVFATEQAARTGLTPAAFRALPIVEKFAWNWAMLNEKALADLAAVRGGMGVRVLRYEDLCADPRREAASLFAFAGLPWAPQTDAFLARSTRHAGPERYYSVLRNTAATDPAARWREQLDAKDQRCIRAVVAQSPLRRFWPDLA